MEKARRRNLRHWGWLVGILASVLVLVVFLVNGNYSKLTALNTTLVVRKAFERLPKPQYQGMNIKDKPSSQRNNNAPPLYQGIDMVPKNTGRKNNANPPPFQGINVVRKNMSGQRNIASQHYEDINMATEKNNGQRNIAGPSFRGINMVTKNSDQIIVARTQYPRVSILRTPSQVILDNGFVQLIFSRPSGDVIGIKYKGIDNLLEKKNLRNNRGYWDVAWNNPGESMIYVDKLQATRFRIITVTAYLVEISFVKTYNASWQHDAPEVPLSVDKRYIMQRGSSGFYAYAIFNRLEGWPEVKMDQIRMVYKLQQDKFQYMAVSNTRQTYMPKAKDRRQGQQLAYPEAVLLTKSSNPNFKGQVDDKYQYSMEDKDNKVHGWICTDKSVGFWMITPSDEFRSAGPMKQDLTSHVGPTTLSMFVSTHYAGKQAGIELKKGESWQKVLGPVFVYLNSAPSSKNSISTLWNDAKQQMSEEVKKWPYEFAQSKHFPSSHERGSVSGRLLVRDRYMNESLFPGSSANVGLAAPGEVGSWQQESKGYQFWTRADGQGYFVIKHVRPGNYSLYGWVPGIVGDYKYEANITVEPGTKIKLGNITYEPPRNGPTLWEIGIPDRRSSEFHVPEPYPTLMNKLLKNNQSEKFRQYGLWARYEELYPNHDLIYTIGVNNYHDDWFYAHVTRNIGKGIYIGTTWQIRFELHNFIGQGNYTLQLALASATSSELQVRFNNRSVARPHFSTGLIGGDNAIARHGIHGLYWFFSVNVPSSLLHNGTNTIYLTQSRGGSPFRGIMYDYIRLEGPPGDDPVGN